MNGEIGELRCAVPPHPAAPETVQTEDDFLIVEVPASVGANAAAVLGNIVGSESVGTRARAAGARSGRTDEKVCARKDAVAEPVVQSEDLVVSKARVKRGLGDDIWRWVEGIAACRATGSVVDGGGSAGGRIGTGRATSDSVVVTVACARCAEQEIVRVAVGGE